MASEAAGSGRKTAGFSMTYKVLILGASYGSLLGTKLVMAGHDVTLVCRPETARLINVEGTEVRIRFRGEDQHRSIRSADQPGRLDAAAPGDVDPSSYDLVALAMQEPQYSAPELRQLMVRIGAAKVPCLSIMNMPPLPYLKRIEGLDTGKLEACYASPRVWDGFDPDLMTLCSPDPQAYRPAGEKPNVLDVGLATNFKAAPFADDRHTRMLMALARDIDAVRLDGLDVPVKLRIHDSLFVPLAKWSMLLTGNYRCVTAAGAIAIKEAVLGDIALSRQVYDYVDGVAQRLGARKADQVTFEKYARAAEGLLKPSSAARAIEAGSCDIERVDKLVQLVGRMVGLPNIAIDAIVATVDARLDGNRRDAA